MSMVTVSINQDELDYLIEANKFAYSFYKERTEETREHLQDMERNDYFQTVAEVLGRFVDKLERIKLQK